jgi:K+-transporting ATPase ATPase C chain
MLREILTSVRAIVVLLLVTCVAYPLLITAIGQLAFPAQAGGSLVRQDERLVGSALLAQKFTDPRYFWPRPSAVEYGTVASGASNQGYLSQKLLDAINSRRAALGPGAPADLLTASASGLDPHISEAAARFEIPRVAAARQVDPARLEALVAQTTERRQLGFLGEPRVNVLLLNRALDRL